MSVKNYYQCCSVPNCGNTTNTAPTKLYIHVPANPTIRQKWLELAKIDQSYVSPKSNLFFCEDHFDLPNDMENYMEYHLMGSVKRIIMKTMCLPSRFECQDYSIRKTTQTDEDSLKRRKSLVEELLRSESNLASKMTELEKFKRRLIRMVARLHVQEKKPEDELWAYLRKQTKCDCNLLWKRMRALTLKKLKRLLIAEDRQDNIAAIARMTLTDWLLFDCILVHEDIDVIGTELMVENRTSEPRPMFELFSLVQRFGLEGSSGENLARAWTAATMAYNSTGRQCSPMLLQRRWYQLKEITRKKFYNFWFSYRGNARLLPNALKDKPTRLQAAVAKRYPHIITTQFRQWEDLIDDKLVIMPPEFEIQMKLHTGQFPAPISDNDIDLVLLEPEIETIDLGVDSDSENDVGEEDEGDKIKELTDNEDVATVDSADALKGISLKQEPIDVDIDPVDSIDLDSDHMKKINEDIDHLEGIEALENINIPIEENNVDDFNVESSDANSVEENITQDNTLHNSGELEDENKRDNSDVFEDVTKQSEVIEKKFDSNEREIPNTDVVSLTTKENEILSHSGMPYKTLGHCIESIEDVDRLNTESSTFHIENTTTVAEITPKTEQIDIPEVNLINDSLENNEDEIAMPQIANIYGNVNISDEALHELSKREIEQSIPGEENIDEDFEDDIIKTETVGDSDNAENVDINQIDGIQAECKIDEIKSTEIKFNDDSLHDVIPDVIFEDDGIEFIDDGIVEEQDGVQLKDSDINLVKQDASSEEKNNIRESQSIDLKLLMVPVVYTKKLDHMHVFRDKLLSHVNDKDTIELVLAESKPVNRASIKIKEEKPIVENVPDDEENTHDDLFDREESADNVDSESENDKSDGIPEDKKVDMSSPLFQKPINRDYGPLVICKNPDFNTRLKRLTVGFLSYSRNRVLLRECKPLTIDLCKEFESKLVDNTLYLKQSNSCGIVVKQETPDTNSEHRQTPPIVSQEKVVQTTVVTTTKSVQSIIKNLHTDIDDILPSTERVSTLDISTQSKDKDIVTERNKVINLPNIDNVRRINQQLLVAEVSPMRIENSKTNPEPPVSLVAKPSFSKTGHVSKPSKKDIGGTVICSGQVIDGVNIVSESGEIMSNYRKSKLKIGWRPVDFRTNVGFWNNSTSANKSQLKQCHSSDQLLTVDTLNKMLNIITLKDPLNEIILCERAKDNKSTKSKQAVTNQKKSLGVHDREHIIANGLVKRKTRIRRKRSKLKDSDPSLIKVCESIECVVEQSSKVVENETSEFINEHNKNDIAMRNIIDRNTSESNIARNNIINVDAPEVNEDHEIIVTDEKNTESVNTVENETMENNIADDNVQNEIEVESGIISTENENTKSGNKVDEIVIDRKKDEINLDDCVVIDSDEPETPRTVLPVKVSLVSAAQPGEVKRGRGRPPKNKFLQFVPTLKPITKPKARKSTPTRVHQAQSDRVTRSRFNENEDSVKPVDTDEDKVLFLNSTHINKRQSNNPIFIGKNKILLTDAPLPSLKKKQVDDIPSPAVLNTGLSLPQGVNLMLLPNGVLTCTVEPSIQLSPEEITHLGAVIEMIQSQINSALSNIPAQIVPPMPSGPTVQPTLQLLPGAVPTVVQNNSAIVNLVDEESKVEIPTADNKRDSTLSTDTISTVETIASTAVNNDAPGEAEVPDKPTLVSAAVITDSVHSNLDVVEADTIIDKTNAKSTGMLETDKNTSVDKNITNTDISMQVESLECKTSTDPESENGTSEQPEVTKNKKTILSDLMEMSGIFDEDIAPVAETPPQVDNVVPETNPDIVIAPLINTTPSQTVPRNVTNALPELTPVTSFQDLKCAFMNNGKFFKLDLVTRILTPINVCIKKKMTCEAPKQYVDLTQDADDDTNTTNEDHLPVYIVRKVDNKDKDTLMQSDDYLSSSALPINNSSSQEPFKQSEKVKPLKLFKVIHPLGGISILKKKRIDGESNESENPVLEVNSKATKRGRKQKFGDLTYEMQYLNFVESDGVENYEIDGSYEERGSDGDGDSSDDEPLAKKVRRKAERQIESITANEATETPSTSEVNEQNSSESEPVVVTPTDPQVISEAPSDADHNRNVELPLLEQMDVVDDSITAPSELEFISGSGSEADEDCILGV